MHTKKIAIIGAGNMGSCLLGGLIANQYPQELLWISNPAMDKLASLQQQFKANFNITTNNIEAAQTAEVILLAVKPLMVPNVLRELAPIINKNKPLIISIAAGIHEKIIQHFVAPTIPIIRAMPNTPTILNCGASALYANPYTTQVERDIAENIFRAVGIVVWLNEESLIDAATAVSGSGPAYFFLIIEAMQKAGVSLGLPPEVSHLLTLQTAYGASCMALESEKNITDLRAQVTSKGGTTEAAIHVLEKANIQNIFLQALESANKRARELAAMITKEME